MRNLRICPPATLLSSFLALAAAVAAAAPGDWPQWHGPNHDNKSTETGLLKDWPEGGPQLVWKATGLGAGYSAVTAMGNRLYTAGDRGSECFVLALNREDGKIVWSSKLGKAGPVGQPQFEGPRMTPTTDGERVYAVSQWGEMACYSAADGKELWRKDYVKDFGGAWPTWGYAESVLIDGDQIVVTPGGSQGAMVAMNKKTGAVLWQSKEFTDPAHYSSMVVADLGGVHQYIQLTPASVAGIAATDGKLLWRAPRKGAVAVIPDPVYDDGYVYVSSYYGTGCHLFKVTAADGKFSAEQVYPSSVNKVMVNHHGGLIKVGDCIYGYSDGKGWTCQDFKTGEARWQEKEKLGKGSLTYADGHFYLREEGGKGTVALIEATPDGYKEHGRFAQPDRSSKNSWPHPVIAGGKLYLRDQDTLLCYDVQAK